MNNLVVDHIVVAVDLANGTVDVAVAGRIDCTVVGRTVVDRTVVDRTVVDRTVVEVLDCKNWRRISLIGHQSIAVDC